MEDEPILIQDSERQRIRFHKRHELASAKLENIGSDEISVICPIENISVFIKDRKLYMNLDGVEHENVYVSVFINTSSSASVIMSKRRGYRHALNITSIKPGDRNKMLGTLLNEEFYRLSSDLFGHEGDFASLRVVLSHDPLYIAIFGDIIQIINSDFQTVSMTIKNGKISSSSMRHRFNRNDKDYVLMRTYANKGDLDNNPDNHKCICCIHNRSDILLMPCRHQSLCANCVKIYAEKLDCCPLCKVPIRVMLAVTQN